MEAVGARLESREALDQERNSILTIRRGESRRLVSLCAGSGCSAYGTAKVYQVLGEEIKRQGLEESVEIKLTGCHGFCEKGPIMVVHPEGIFYPQVKEDHISQIVEKTIRDGEVVESLLLLRKRSSPMSMISRFISCKRGSSSATTGRSIQPASRIIWRWEDIAPLARPCSK
jgi:(2Fe-2S) ferredoxin